MPDFKAIQFTLENQVAWVTMNRPDARNAVNAEMREELIAVLSDARSNGDIRALVLTGSGKGFCTGADLSGPRGQGPSGPGAGREVMKQSSQRLIRALWELEKPVIAAVNGVAAGLGSHLAFASDLVIAAQDARFIEIFVRRGIAIDAAGAFLLPRLIGLSKAKELVFFGEDLSADAALGLGLVNKVVPGDQLAAAAREWAEKLAQGPTFAIGMSKRLLNRSLESSLETALEEEALVQSLVTQSEDTREGMTAFMERRTPQFKGK
ncbi:MAG: enoyl-CoA hydratase/isomerase family protein [Deltaproteobacteria bacterium]|nr:enoyl-CoA hydratase/isomerase family protein [Deltaproteobacteria bacterium]MBI3387093.1 enoyl-CoA hydratase/isomerase family protein [Deltaproteobacteria bacterium]